MTPDPGFTMIPLGPRTDAEGRWCCGLHCVTGIPGDRKCPYRLKVKPEEKQPCSP